MATRITGPAKDQPRIIVDCTHTFQTGAGTGIQRVVRRFADSLLEISREEGVEVVPVRFAHGALIPLPLEAGRVAFPRAASARESITQGSDERLAKWRGRGHGLNRLLGSTRLQAWLDAGPNEDGLMRMLNANTVQTANGTALQLRPSDILLSLDSSWVYDIRTALDNAGRIGVTRISVLCDVLPLSHPEYFTEGTRRWFGGWLGGLLPRLEGVVTISEATRAELLDLVARGELGVSHMPDSRAVHLGAEIEGSCEGEVRPELREAYAAGRPPAFLTVGTLEPRKNVDYAIDIFDALLAAGVDAQWHVVGAAGWLAEHTAQRLHRHPQFGNRLHWWQDLRDAELTHCYRHCAALVAVSKAEGFGLPLVEARLHGVRVFASDIPVFREVLGGEGRYLPLGSAALAAVALQDFVAGTLPMPARDVPSKIARSWLQRARELLHYSLALQAQRTRS